MRVLTTWESMSGSDASRRRLIPVSRCETESEGCWTCMAGGWASMEEGEAEEEEEAEKKPKRKPKRKLKRKKILVPGNMESARRYPSGNGT